VVVIGLVSYVWLWLVGVQLLLVAPSHYVQDGCGLFPAPSTQLSYFGDSIVNRHLPLEGQFSTGYRLDGTVYDNLCGWGR